MSEQEEKDKQTGKQKAKKASAGAKKPAAKKASSAGPEKNEAKKAAAEQTEEKPPMEEEVRAPSDEEAAAPEEEETEQGPSEEEEMSEEEFRRLVEESLEKVTVADIALTMMNQLASVGYMKMGLPENVNLKYRDFDQARLAIDILDAILKGAEGKVPEELLQPFRGTLANLQMNFFQLSRGQG
jgi:hypothetical protein